MSYQPPPYEPPPSSGQPYSAGPYGAQPQYGQPYGQQPYTAPPYGQQPPLPPPTKQAGQVKIILITVGTVLAVCLGAFVVIAFAGGSSDKPKASVAAATDGADTPPAEDEQPAEKKDTGGKFGLKLGTKVTVTGDGTTQHVTVKSVKTFKKACNRFMPAPDHGTFLVADVLVEVVDGTVPVNALSFKWVGADGTTSDSLDGAFSGCDKSPLDTGDVRAGQKRAGQIVFDVKSAKGAVEFTPGIFDSAVASWTI